MFYSCLSSTFSCVLSSEHYRQGNPFISFIFFSFGVFLFIRLILDRIKGETNESKSKPWEDDMGR